MICIYCGKHNPPFSDEHIWPKRLGGSQLPHDLFRTGSVCRMCNGKCGLYVDGPFIKSWLITNEAADSATAFLDPQKPSAVPLIYLGLTKDVEVETGEVCERWLGPTGDHIYFFHKKDDDDWNSLSGGDILARKKWDTGHAYMNLTSASNFWQNVAILSFKKGFPNAKRLIINAGLGSEGHSSQKAYELVPVPDKDDFTQLRHLKSIGAQSGEHHQAGAVIDILFDRRFSMKLALGVGFNLFGEDFLQTNYAKRLQKELWNTDPTDIMGKSFLSEKDADPEGGIFGVKGAWTLTLTTIQNVASLIVSAPSGKVLTIVVHPDWQRCGLKMSRDLQLGQSFVIAPHIHRSWGPVSVYEIAGHNLKVGTSRVVKEILSTQTKLSELPPKENGIELPRKSSDQST